MHMNSSSPVRARVAADSMPAPPSERLLPEMFPGLALHPNERLLASLHLDVDDQLRFAPGLLLLSDGHVHLRQSSGEFHSLPITNTLSLHRHEHAGLTELSFFDSGRRVLTARYPLAVAVAGNDFVTAYEGLRGRAQDRPPTPDADPELEDELALSAGPPLRHPLWRLLG